MPERPLLRVPVFKSTFTRAVVPVAGGIAAIALILLAMWGVAAVISDNPDSAKNLIGPSTFRPGHVENYARIVEQDGPVLFPDLLGTDGDRSVVLDHEGDDPMEGWRIYLAHPKDRPISCKVSQVRHTDQFVDCEGRTIPVTGLAPPPAGVHPVVSRDGILDLDLNPAPSTTAP